MAATTSTAKTKATALTAKEKGNAAFKVGDYPTAIGHYTSAVLADPSEPTYPLNRAAAYLKLGKNEDAERDCSKTLQLSGGKNAKALFRRAQARVGLNNFDGARKDLQDAAKLEPKNQSIVDELKKVEALQSKDISSGKARAQPISVSTTPLPTQQTRPPHPNRRRIPIEIVESSSSGSTSSTTPSTSDSSLLNPISTRSLSSDEDANKSAPANEEDAKPASETPKPKPTPSTFKEAKQARDTSRTGGGVFRASGSYTLFKDHNNQSPPTSEDKEKPAPSTPLAEVNGDRTSSISEPQQPTPSLRPPIGFDDPNAKLQTTLFNFSREWDRLRSSSAEARWDLLSHQIPPSTLPTLFQTSLEPTLLSSLLSTFHALLTTHSSTQPELKDWIRSYMVNFTKVPRFGTVLLFMSKGEKEDVERVWRALGESGSAEDAKERKKWGLRW